MPAQSPPPGPGPERSLRELGERLRERRKQLGLTAVATAEAAGMSRVTLHRIEKGEPSVAVGAYLNVVDALGLQLELADPRIRERQTRRAQAALPQEVALKDYPQLEKLAWSLRGRRTLSPPVALKLYERNWRHVETGALDPREQDLLDLLLEAFGRERLLV